MVVVEGVSYTMNKGSGIVREGKCPGGYIFILLPFGE